MNFLCSGPNRIPTTSAIMEMFATTTNTTTNNNSSTKENSLNIPEKDMCQSSSSAPSSPTKGSVSFTEMLNKKTDPANASKSVKFPEDHFIVTGYHDAPDPFGSANDQNEENDQLDLDTIIKAFTDACAKQNIEPMPSVLEQIKKFKSIRERAQDLILRGQKLESHQCEALEEILKRVLFRLIDLDSCDLDCDGASALFDMIEFYESASHLSIANNKSIGIIGWQALCRTLKKTSCLQYLDLSNTGLNEQILLFMGRTIRVGSHLVTLHLENAGLFGRRLAILVSSIKFNTSLRELYLGENKIGSADCVQIGNLLRGNSFLNVLDLRNNLIQDTGLDHVCEGLAHQPYASPGAGSGSIFGLFDPNHKRNTAAAAASKTTPMSQNNGILIMNLSNNQLTSRAMNRLAQTLPNCRSLIGLDLSYNPIGDEGIFILKESLLNCPTLKYLNLTETDIGQEGIRTVADILQGPTSLTVVDLSNNNNNNNNQDFGLEGLMAIRDAVVTNKRIQKVIIGGGGGQSPDSINQSNPLWAQLLEEIENHCQKHQAEATFDEFDSILNGFLRKDISVYLEIDQSTATDDDYNKENVDNNTNTNDDNYQTCDSTNDSINVNDDDHQPGSKKPLLARTASLGSWERPVKSGRFSVQPVDQPVVVQNHDQNNNNQEGEEEEPALSTPIRIHIESDYSQVQVEPRGEQEAGPRSSAQAEEEEEEEEENEGSDLSEQETDQLPELPARFAKKKDHLAPPSRSFRRMSSPVLSVSGIVKPKPKPNLSLKLSGNLESLDLKSSTPLSPTFFAKFDFSDISLLRLPAEVEEIISNIDHSITDDLIIQFENFCCEKPSKLKQSKQQQQQLDQQEQCVY